MPAHRGYLGRPFSPMRLATYERHPLEAVIEAALVRQLGTIPGRVVERQVDCCGNKPDVVVLWAGIYSIVEVKREVIGWRALDQITRYVDHWIEELAPATDEYTVMGILVAPAIRPSVASELRGIPWCAYQPVQLVRRAA